MSMLALAVARARALKNEPVPTRAIPITADEPTEKVVIIRRNAEPKLVVRPKRVTRPHFVVVDPPWSDELIEHNENIRQLCGVHDDPSRRVWVEDIIAIVADYYLVSVNDVLSARRSKDISRIRHIAMFLATTLTLLSQADIGRRFKRDHTTVLHAVRKIEGEVATDLKLAKTIAILRGRILK